MLRLLLAFVLYFGSNGLMSQQIHIPFETNNNYTPTYEEVIDIYKQFDKHYNTFKLIEAGPTDSGKPLHIAVFDASGVFDPDALRDKTIIFINNAIHPGEPCGVDASLLLFKDILEHKKNSAHLADVVLVCIPIYNISGALNRNGFSRANQNGPEAYGFRGNVKNLDLNRDFIKCDSKNAQSFNRIFTQWQPDIFVDNHTSNGADYPYVITLIDSQKDKTDPHLSVLMQNKILPFLYENMLAKGFEMAPYVYSQGPPDTGIYGFLDTPRYSSGYGTLHNAISFTLEAHMLKPYSARVLSTKAFLENLIAFGSKEKQAIKEARQKAMAHTKTKSHFDIHWQIDLASKDSIIFKGYTAEYLPSQISGQDRLWYNQSRAYKKYIPYFNNYVANITIKKPMAYIFPQAYDNIANRLRWNGVKIDTLKSDSIVRAEFYYIADYDTRDAYEAHYLHSNVKVSLDTMSWQFYAGDYIVKTNQSTNRYIIETLEPQAHDAFFAWNFFDGILQQKEHFSPYVFEDLAHEYLHAHPSLKSTFDKKIKNDSLFAQNAQEQLKFIYEHTDHFEKTYRLYPVARLIE